MRQVRKPRKVQDMSDCFYQILTGCLKEEGLRHRSVELDPAVWQEFLSDVPAVSAVAPERKPAAVTENVPTPSSAPSSSAPDVGPVTATSAPVAADGPEAALAALAEEVRVCRRCRLCEKRHLAVFGEGNPRAELMFIGEGPGADEDRTGRPFVGRAGQLLDKMIAAMTFAREEVYIANVVKCRPPGNRAPEPDEAAACIGYLKRQIELIRPKVIVSLGGVALSFLFKESAGISRMRGHWIDFNGIPVMPTFHPAFLLRQESAKRDAWSDLQQVMARLGRKRQR